MNRMRSVLPRNCEGMAAIEFAVGGSIIICLLCAVLQFGIAMLANAGLRQGVETAARYATIYPRPTDDQIRAKVIASTYGLNTQNLPAPTITHGVRNGKDYVQITATYSSPLKFILVQASPISMTYSRLAYLAPS